MKGIIIQGSSRSNGNTNKIAQILMQNLDFDLIDLNTKVIGSFDYDFHNRQDDFLPLFRKIVNEYSIIIFATPVYWYSMSGILKNFFDRISDLLKIEKETGRKLRGKFMGVISCGSDSDQTEGFFIPFQKSAAYLGMNYIGDIHTWVEDESLDGVVNDLITEFSKKIEKIQETVLNAK